MTNTKLSPTAVAPTATPAPSATTAFINQPNLLATLQSGMYLVYSVGDGFEADGYTPKNSLSVVSVDGSSYGELIDGVTGKLSPDLKYLAYVLPDQSRLSQDAYVFDLENSAASPRLVAPDCTAPSWSPDSSKLAVDCRHRFDDPNPNNLYTHDIYIVSLSNDSIIPLTDCLMEGEERKLQGYSCNSPAWSPDGKWIATIRGEAKSGEKSSVNGLYLTNISCVPDLITCTPDTYGPFGDLRDYSWSPDSEYLATVLDLNKIILLSVETGKQQPLVVLDGVIESLAWSPDGKWIAFTQSSKEPSGIFIVSSEGGEPKQLVAKGQVAFWLTIP